MHKWLTLLAMVVVLPVHAATVVGRGDAVTATPAPALLADELVALEPAGGTLLDEKIEDLKDGEEQKEAAAPLVDLPPAKGPDILNRAEIQATKAALAAARSGKMPSLNGVPAALHGYVQAAYYLGAKSSPSAATLRQWLVKYRELPVAGDIYQLAETKREKPRQVCSSKTITPKATQKNKKPKPKKVRSCRTVGSWGPETPKTTAQLAREDRREAAEAAQTAKRNRMSDAGRRVATEVWRQRSRGNYPAALNALLAPGARLALGGAYWQEELVRIADFYHGKREWGQLYKAASAAAQAQGPERDDALWLAGYAAYRLGERGKASGYWQTLVNEEPKNGSHYGRAAWWGARVLADMGQGNAARALLAKGAEAKLTFYGQLAAAKLGQEAKLNFSAPGVPSDGLAALLANAQARRGLALAQLNETAWAEAELRAATPNLPLQANRALAGLAASMNLPSAALRAGRDLYEKGDIVGAALYPVPLWKPQGGWQFDRAFMLGLMRQESAFQPTIGSRVGAQGLMQIMPATGHYIARMTGRKYRGKADLHDPATNLAMAQDYLKYLSGRLDGSMLLVAASYNGGIGNVQRWLARGITPDADPLLWLESIPFDETRDYVEKVMLNYWVYQQRLGVPRTSLNDLANNRWPSH